MGAFGPQPEQVDRIYVVECYWPGVTRSAMLASAERLDVAAHELSTLDRPLRLLGSGLVPADETAFYLLLAASDLDVAEASSRAGLRFERVVECQIDSNVEGERS